MKKVFLLLAVFAVVTGYSQKASPHDTLRSEKATVTYGRPYKKGREIFGGLEKYGNVWRLGADEATTITFAKDVKFLDTKVPAGTYTVFAIPTEKSWTIILNSQLGQWGAFSYQKYKEKDVAYAIVPVKKLDKVVEQLTLSFDKEKALVIEWDQTQVKVPLDY